MRAALLMLLAVATRPVRAVRLPPTRAALVGRARAPAAVRAMCTPIPTVDPETGEPRLACGYYGKVRVFDPVAGGEALLVRDGAAGRLLALLDAHLRKHGLAAAAAVARAFDERHERRARRSERERVDALLYEPLPDTNACIAAAVDSNACVEPVAGA